MSTQPPTVQFIFIIEALTRIILDDTRIEGIEVDGIIHKISQYADDSTLIATPLEIPFFNEDLLIYLDATGARENAAQPAVLSLSRGVVLISKFGLGPDFKLKKRFLLNC